MSSPRRKRPLAVAGGLTLGATLASGGVAHAATFTVNSLKDPVDSGHTTLHDAITMANAVHDPSDKITFASGLSGSINLTADLPSIDFALDIVGPGASRLTVSGNHARGIFHSVGLANPGLQISGLTLANGNNVADTRGGAVFVAGGSPASITDSVLIGNTAQKGGAVYTLNGTLDVQRSTFVGNKSSTGVASGGAIESYGTAVVVSNSLISANSAVEGGGIESSKADSSLLIQNSTVSGNRASSCCGGIFATSSKTTVVRNSTISGNTVTAGPSGGMYVEGPLVVTDSTIAGNSGTSGPDVRNGVSAAFSLIGNPAGATIQNATPGSNLTGVDPQLQPLAGNGGPTPTMALAATSPAIDKGSAFGLSTDQRGSGRPFDLPSISNSTAPGADGSDIGAFEVLQPPATPNVAPAAPKKCKKKKHKRRAAAAKKCKKKRKKK